MAVLRLPVALALALALAVVAPRTVRAGPSSRRPTAPPRAPQPARPSAMRRAACAAGARRCRAAWPAPVAAELRVGVPAGVPAQRWCYTKPPCALDAALALAGAYCRAAAVSVCAAACIGSGRMQAAMGCSRSPIRRKPGCARASYHNTACTGTHGIARAGAPSAQASASRSLKQGGVNQWGRPNNQCAMMPLMGPLQAMPAGYVPCTGNYPGPPCPACNTALPLAPVPIPANWGTPGSPSYVNPLQIPCTPPPGTPAFAMSWYRNGPTSVCPAGSSCYQCNVPPSAPPSNRNAPGSPGFVYGQFGQAWPGSTPCVYPTAPGSPALPFGINTNLCGGAGQQPCPMCQAVSSSTGLSPAPCVIQPGFFTCSNNGVTTSPTPVPLASPPPPPPPSPSPPPHVYTSSRLQVWSHPFNKFLGPGNSNPHKTGPFTSTSTDSTTRASQNRFITTTTTDATQVNTGNGHIKSQWTSTTSTETRHPTTKTFFTAFPSTTDLPVPTDASVPPAPPVCAGDQLQVQQVGSKNMCMSVRGSVSNGVFTVKPSKRPVVATRCSANSPNQRFTWVPTAQGGELIHTASKMAVSLVPSITGGVKNNAAVTVVSSNTGLAQEWLWENPATGGVIRSMLDQEFEITSTKVKGTSPVGTPVHMWHLTKALPLGAPSGEWAAVCVAN